MAQRWNQPAARMLARLTFSVFISISPAVFGQPSMPAAFSGTTPGSSGSAERIVGSVDEILTVERIEVGSAASSEGERTRQEVLTFSRGALAGRGISCGSIGRGISCGSIGMSTTIWATLPRKRRLPGTARSSKQRSTSTWGTRSSRKFYTWIPG